MRYSAIDIARALEQPEPTLEQQEVIEAGPAPLLVVAGAGSGKTETMAARVVWLVANGIVEPDQVLGLTFTRKAAAELAARITGRLRTLGRTGLWTPPVDDGTGAEVLGGTPTVSTYHAYAGRLVREHALRLGIEPEYRVLTEAGAWQLAAEAVERYDGPMDEVGKAGSTIIDAVMSLAGELAEHLRTPEDLISHLDSVIEHLEGLPDGAGRGSLVPVRELVTILRERRAVAPIVARFVALKRARDSLDFADQMALAARLATTVPAVGEIERQRFRAVLLDEFQDTSEAQLSLLHALFHRGSDPVALTAVGDPNQSIYGWRGASATTLARFPHEFADDTGPARVLPLSTSWRNDEAILAAANITSHPLRTAHVRPLTARPGAGQGAVTVARLDSLEQEAAHAAAWIAARWRSPSGRRTGRTAAVLCRRRAHFPVVIDALRAQGLPIEVVGLGGLLMTPEVSDLVAGLWVVQDPSRGDQLMRLLTGPVARLGPADINALWGWARELQRRPWRPGHPPAHQDELPLREGEDAERPEPDDALPPPAGGDAPTPDREDLAPDSADEATLVEALDELPPPGWVATDGARLSPAAYDRLVALSAVVRTLRRLTALPLVDLVGEAERALGLDLEVLSRPEHTGSTARVHLDAFGDAAARFAATADRPKLSGFLAWLEAARSQERGLELGHVETDHDAVQVLTVHAAKGLEWDVVAVPALVESVFPSHSSSSVGRVDDEWVLRGRPTDKGWLTGLDGVPYELRGDRDGLPVLDWRGAPDRKALGADIATFAEDGGDHAVAEERRLAYVAFTRARSDLLVSTHFWSSRKTINVESRFLAELREGLGDQVATSTWAVSPEPVLDAKGALVPPPNPFLAEPVSGTWPNDPMARRRLLLAEGVDRVLELLRDDPGPAPSGDPRHDDLRLLLAEQSARRSRGPAVVEVPRHLSASAVVSLARDAEAFALHLRRPMPGPPALSARRGTAFHAWIEEHFSRATMVDLFDLPGSADDDAAHEEDLDRMKELFLASEWAGRIPEEIELAIETVIDGIAVRGRIDAVFPQDDGGWTVVDWKTGVPPTGREAQVRAIQLAAYTVAFARLRDVPPDSVDGAFYYAAHGVTVRPDLPQEAHLATLLATLPEQ
jgi:DNA helicase-2/ATP-dependent DNA helicase PcrA